MYIKPREEKRGGNNMAEMEMKTDRPVQEMSIADYGKDSLAYLKEARGVLASIYGNITSNRPDNGEDKPATCLRDDMFGIRETAMQIREIARNINIALFNE